MNELLRQADEALHAQDGRKALELTDAILAEDERCWQAWLIALRSFQLILPIDACDAQNELTCARWAVRFAPKEEKRRVKKQVWTFLYGRILDVLKRDAEVLADARELVGFYQRTVYYDATGAARKTLEHDQPVREAVLRTFDYCDALFDAVPDSEVRRGAMLNRQAAEIAEAWAHTYSCYAMRLGLCHCEMTREGIQEGLKRYARYLRCVRGREDIIRKTVAFNTLQEDQAVWLEPAAGASANHTQGGT